VTSDASNLAPQTADKIAVEVLGIPEDGDLATAAVTAAVLPGGGRLTQDDLLTLPPKSDVKVTSLTLDGQVRGLDSRAGQI
jgi:hypothetical protein